MVNAAEFFRIFTACSDVDAECRKCLLILGQYEGIWP